MFLPDDLHVKFHYWIGIIEGTLPNNNAYIIDMMYMIYYNGGVREMNDMLTLNATDVRRDWSEVVDKVVREKPQFIKRTRDYLMLSDLDFMESLLGAYQFTAVSTIEEDSSVTLSLNEIDLVENGKTVEEAKQGLAEAIMEYSEEFYRDFNYWGTAPNRKEHIPYVFKALILGNAEKIGELITCQNGKN